MTGKWEDKGRDLVEAINQATTTEQIKDFCDAVIAEIVAQYDNLNSRKNPLHSVRKVIKTAFLDIEDITSQPNEFYQLTNGGKGNVERYQHVSLKFLTLPKEDWELLRGETTTEKQPEQPEQPEEIQPKEVNLLTIIREKMDTEKLSLIEKAATQIGVSLEEFVLNAVEEKAKSINNKKINEAVSLAEVTTDELLKTDVKAIYTRHPNRIEELTKRAIIAIQTFNDNCTEQSQKWFISATTINSLTGCRTMEITKILKSLDGLVSDHNNKHGLTVISNRGKGIDITEVIDLASMVPDGLDL